MVRMNFQLCQRVPQTPHFLVMLSEALQPNAKHEGRLSKHLWLFIPALRQKGSEILRFAQNDKSP
jgi:hypothetical protein